MEALLRRKFAQELGKTSDRLADKVFAEVRAELPDIVNPAMSDAFYASSVANVKLFNEFVASDGDRRVVRIGSTPRNIARSLAARGQPLSSLLILFHRGHNVLEAQLLTLLSTIVSEQSPEQVLSTLSDVRQLSNSYAAIRTDQLATVFAEESARLQIPGDPGLLHEVQRALQDHESAESIGGHKLAGPQVGYVVWGGLHATPNPEKLLEAAHAVARSLGSINPPLVVFSSPVAIWAWCHPSPDKDTPSWQKDHLIDVRRVVNVLPDHIFVAIGPRLSDLDGFKRSHQLAKLLRNVLEAQAENPEAPRIIDAGMDGALTAAAMVDRLPLAAEIVRTTLGDLAVDNDYAAVIRSTARAFLAHGIAGAATQMVVHRNTVKYRIEKFRDVMGKEGSVDADARFALELAHWLGKAVIVDSDDPQS